MRLWHGMIAVLGIGIMYATPVRADHQAVIAIPGHPDAPVIIDGRDATWAVVEGDWGLYRPGQMTPAIGPSMPPYLVYPRPYYPFTGKRPRLGRHEIIPPANRPLPKPAESYYRYWSNDGLPPVPAQTEYPAFAPPPVIVAPRVNSRN